MDDDHHSNAWEEFITHKEILPEVSPMIANSWQRCWGRINPKQKINFYPLHRDHLLAAQVASFDLISIARPVMEDIYQNTGEPGMTIMLLNATGYVLEIMADSGTQESLAALGVLPGALMTELHVGTNGLGLALAERMPIKVQGQEHYSRQFHAYTSAAAPIFEATGRPLGVLGTLLPESDYQPGVLGLMVAGAKAIEAQLQADTLLAEYNSQFDQLNAVLDTISEGIMVWNGQNTLVLMNKFAIKILDTPPQNLLGQRIGETISYPPFILEAIEKREPLTDVETYFNMGKRTVTCILNVRFVYNKKDLMGVIVTFRPIQEVRLLVQQQVGANAFLTLRDIPGDSPQMKRVHHFVRAVSPASAAILLRGETGTGKNVLAGAIHNESPRRDGPFIIFSCASVPTEMVARELLGREGGLPNQAGGRPSKFELAQGGTIFFPNVEALPLDAQMILLNVLEMRILQRLGSDRPIEVDVRVIASTSAPIETLVEQGSFRSDLFYRLSTFTITLPPLRERTRDIPDLADRIIQRVSGQFVQPLSFGPGVVEVLKKYTWPGNIREIEAVLGLAAAQTGGTGVIELQHLPLNVRYAHSKNSEAPVEVRTITNLERDAILQSARIFCGNLTHMAHALGIGRTTLWRKIKDYDISIESFREK